MGTEVLYLDVGWFVCCVSKLYWFISNMQIKTRLKVKIHGKKMCKFALIAVVAELPPIFT